MSRKEISEALAADVNARSIVYFVVRFFRVKSLSHLTLSRSQLPSLHPR